MDLIELLNLIGGYISSTSGIIGYVISIIGTILSIFTQLFNLLIQFFLVFGTILIVFFNIFIWLIVNPLVILLIIENFCIGFAVLEGKDSIGKYEALSTLKVFFNTNISVFKYVGKILEWIFSQLIYILIQLVRAIIGIIP